jgi:hypothetical protein
MTLHFFLCRYPTEDERETIFDMISTPYGASKRQLEYVEKIQALKKEEKIVWDDITIYVEKEN